VFAPGERRCCIIDIVFEVSEELAAVVNECNFHPMSEENI